MNKRQKVWIAIIIVITVMLGGLILMSDKATSPSTNEPHEHASPDTAPEKHEHAGSSDDPHDHEAGEGVETTGKEAESAPSKGPKGGKLFVKNGLGVEVTIFEQGVPPQMRLYLYQNGKPLPPTAATATVTLLRLGASAQVLNFKPEADYLLGDQVVEEPHSFNMAIAVEHKGSTFRWGHSQVEARVEIPDETLKGIGVEIRTAGPITLEPTLKLPGEIAFDERTIVQVVPRVPGIATSVEGQYGQYVKKGEVLAVIESQVLADLRGQFLAAEKRLDLARVTFEREKLLWEEKISAKQDYLAAQQALADAEITSELALAKLRTLAVPSKVIHQRGDLARYEIRAPISGLITARAIAQGLTVKEDASIFTIADISTVWAQITVFAKDLEVLKLGQRTRFKGTTVDVEGEGEISYISPLIGIPTRAAMARVVLENKDGRWRPGMFFTAEVVIGEIQASVGVSTDAIQTLGDHSVVFGRYGKYFEARPLKLGRSDNKMVEVLSGLSAGEQYAAGNSFAIKAELGKAGASHEH